MLDMQSFSHLRTPSRASGRFSRWRTALTAAAIATVLTQGSMPLGSPLIAHATPVSGWTNLTPGTLPSRFTNAVAYDATSHQLVVFGGTLFNPFGSVGGDTWVYENGQWVNLTPATVTATNSPSPRTGAMMAYDAATKQIILWGGADATGQQLTDTWAFDGSTWTNVTPTNPTDSPPHRSGEGMAYDPNLQKVVLFGGDTGNSAAAVLNDTWEWDGTKWANVTPVNPADSPYQRTGQVMSFDSKVGHIVLWGGIVQDPGHFGTQFHTFNDTWEWDGTTDKWIQLTADGAAGSPPASLSSEGYTYDAATGQFLIFGGMQTGGGVSSTVGNLWTFDGTAWTLSTQTNPWTSYGISSETLVFNPDVNQVQMVDPNSDTLWNYDGSTWFKAAPGGLSLTSIAYDKQTNQLIMFGGQDNNRQDQDRTWLWTGQVWQDVTPARAIPGTNYPTAESNHQLAYDDATGQLLLYGGDKSSGHTWSWDGSKWTKIATATTSPSPITDFGMVYDAALKKLVLYGGIDSHYQQSQTIWLWDGSNWTSAPTGSTSAPNVMDFGIAYDDNPNSPTSGDILVFGGYDSNWNTLNSTWAWDGTTWKQVSTSGPSPTLNPNMVYDSQLGRIVLYGDSQTNLWVWNGTDWQSVPSAYLGTSLPPTPRTQSGFAYDGNNGQMMLYGGAGSIGKLYADTWSFGGPIPLASMVQFGASSLTSGANANWTVLLTTSNSGLLTQGSGTITLTAPTGTTFPFTPTSYMIDGKAVTVTPTQTSPNTVTLTVPGNIPSGTAVTISIQGVTNPSAGSTLPGSFTITTSSDTMTASSIAGLTPTSQLIFGNGQGPSGPGAGAGSGSSSGSGATPTPPPFAIASNLIWNAQLGIPFSFSLSTVNGAAPYQWSIVQGALPSGLTLSTNGLISGTATGTDGTTSFTVQVTDASQHTATRTLSITAFGTLPLAVTTTSLAASGALNQPYQGQLSAANQSGPVTWSLSSGSLPPGLTLHPDGSITGTPSVSGTFQFTVKVSDASRQWAYQSLTLTIKHASSGSPSGSTGTAGLTSQQRRINWLGHSIVVPANVQNGTTYMPIWYLMNVLQSFESTTTWDGLHWKLTTTRTPNLSNLTPSPGQLMLYINGTLVTRMPDGTAIDPTSGHRTTYVPIWYLMQALPHIRVQSTWDGTTWTLTSN